MVQFNCPCGRALHAKEEYAGQVTRCPQCGREIPIPGDPAVQAAAPPPREAPPEGVRPEWSRRDDDRGREGRPRPPSTSGMAVASTILGVLSLFLCSVLTGIPALILGALGLRAIGRSDGRLRGKGLAITGLVTGALSLLLLPGILLLLPVVQMLREASERIQSANNLKLIGLAMHNHNSANGGLPAAATCDARGKPLLSWRVALLPYFGEASLYGQFKLDEPWDGPNNSRLIAQMPKLYALPGDTTAPPGYTYYRAFVGPHALFDPPQPNARLATDLARLTAEDGPSDTIMVAEAATPVPWTKPDEELAFDPAGPLPALGGHFSSGFQVLMADGSVRMVSSTVSQPTLRAAITRDGGETLGPDW